MKQLSTLLLLLVAGPALAQTLTNAGAAVSVAAGTVLYVVGGAQNTAGATLTNAGTVQLTGDLANAGTLISTGTLLFTGTTDQTFTPGTAMVSSLALGNTGPAGSNRLFIPADLTVSSLLTLTQGLVRTQGNPPGSPLATLSLPDGARVVGEAAGQYVQGRLAVTRTSVDASTGSVDFTNSFVLNPNGQNLGPVTVTRTAGLQAAGVSYGQNLSGTNQGIDRVWQVVAGQQPSSAAPASITVSWVSDDDHGFNPATPAQLWRADQATGPWAQQGTPASASARSFTANVTQFGTLTVSNTSAPLPVTLVSFTAQRQGEDGRLQWATASELHNDHFVVESSVDGTTFQRLGQVAGAGTTSQGHTYQFLDANLARYATSLVYYRLRQIDTDGTTTYSPVRTVQVPTTEFTAEAYPTYLLPGQALTLLVHLPTAGLVTLLVTDVLGRVIAQQALALPAGASTTFLPTATQWASGLYLLRVQQGRQQQVTKVVRQ